MHLLLPVRRNQPPLVGGRRGGRELCTTTLVDFASLNPLTLAIAIRTIVSTLNTTMCTRLRPVLPWARLRLSVTPSELRSLVGRRLGGSRLDGPRLVEWSPRRVHLRWLDLRRINPVVGDSAGGGGEEGVAAFLPLPPPRPPLAAFSVLPPQPLPAEEEATVAGLCKLRSSALRRLWGGGGMELPLPPRAEVGAPERSRPAPTICQHLQ